MKGTIALAIVPALFSAVRSVHAEPRSTAEPTAGVNPLRNAYFGDLHLHTSFSFDAYIMGARTTPEEAYRFARGESIPYMGHQVRRRWSLDFMAVTDHSENMGVAGGITDPNSAFSQSEAGRRVQWGYGIGPKEGEKVFWDIEFEANYKQLDPKRAASAWQAEIEAANRNYQPGKFTTFIAYEWSTAIDVQYHLHRNVIFKGNTAPLPFSDIDSKKPEDLWTYMEANRRRGIESLAIPHNPNMSNGLMYDWNDSSGKPIDEVYAQRRVLNEPLTEISQTKGQSETHPTLSPIDEFADYEVWNMPGAIHGGYVREAYGRGLEITQKAGANPFKFGVVGDTDIHTGLSLSDAEPYGDMMMEAYASIGYPYYTEATGNVTGVWAEQNTRESIYAALRRKETYATSGARLKFRFFSGWQYPQDVFSRPDWIRLAYARGVPMGGDLPAKSDTAKAPRFIVWALKDPDGANLDRVQVIKVWLQGGHYAENIFDVAYAGNRLPDPKTGKLPPVGNTVDLKSATYTNTIGATELKAVWQDPEFDPKNPAVYYLRVLEIPTPRWSTLNAVKARLPLPADQPAIVQGRGWSSPIWYTPPSEDRAKDRIN